MDDNRPPHKPAAQPQAVPTGTPTLTPERRRAYWRANLVVVCSLMTVWAVVSLGAGVLLADWLNQYRLPGTSFKLGFWFAQQGSIYTFVVLIFIYVVVMNLLDRRFGVREA